MIHVSKLVKYYQADRSVPVLNGVNLEIAEGEFVAIRGRSGSGKTTLLNLIGGLDSPSGGEIAVNGQDITRMSKNQKADFRREQIGFIFQLFYLIPNLNVLQNVMLPLIPYQKHLAFSLEQRAKEILQQVGLKDQAGSFPNYLSGGEQQRVAIARSIIHSPRIILADEPTGNLDPETGKYITGLLKSLNQEYHMTLVLVTHSDTVASAARRILNLRHGVIEN